MTEEQVPEAPTLDVSKPAPLLQRLSIDYRAFFKAAGKAVIKGLSGHWVDAIAELPDAVAALQLSAKPEDRAWVLIRRALSRSALSLLKEYADIHQIIAPEQEDDDNEAEPTVFSISASFFTAPETGDVIDKVKPAFQAWLKRLGLLDHEARNLAERLPSYFVLSIHNEWRANPAYYEPIREALLTPFSAAADRELGWQRYRAYLSGQIDEPVFDQSFSLRQIYIAPRAYRSERNGQVNPKLPLGITDRQFRSGPGRDEDKLVCVWLLDEIIDWVRRKDRDTNIRVISGGPGSGKSSFSKILAEALSKEKLPVLFVPLHQLDLKLDFISAIAQFVDSDGFLAENPLRPEGAFPDVVLILDGLDELEMQGRSTQEVAHAFVRDVIRTIDRLNARELRVRAIISGRELAVQIVQSEFRQPGQVLHILPYYVPSQEREGLKDPNGLLRTDQRDLWWHNYGALTGRKISSIPKVLKQGEIGEVTAQPLLNYLVALSYDRGSVDFSASVNINVVYGDLVKAIYDRAWARHDHPAVRGLTETSFIRLLEEVALAVWHGQGRTTTLREIEEHCKHSRIASMLPVFEQSVSSGISTLLLAFYFRQKGARDGEKAFEFTHKTFGEYLTALRICHSIAQLIGQRRLAQTDPDNAWDEDEALYRWFTLCGPTGIDTYLFDFLRREMELRKGELGPYQEGLTQLYEVFLRRGWPTHRCPHLSYKQQQQHSKNAEEALFCSLNAIARTAKVCTKIAWPDLIAFGEALKRMQGQRFGPPNPLVHRCLSYLDVSGACLDMADLYAADLSYSDFTKAELHFTNVGRALLVGTNFSGARFLFTNLEGVQMRGTDFSGAYMEKVILSCQRNVQLRSSTRRKDIQNLMQKLRMANGQKREQVAFDILIALGAKGAPPERFTFFDTAEYLGYEPPFSLSERPKKSERGGRP
jgi:hypothetical protein